MFDGATEIYNQSFSMVSTRGINDWWKYLFEPIVYRRDLTIPDLPNAGNPTVILSATTSAGNVAIGHFVAGLAAYIGETESGAKVGIRDRSRVDEDEFGVTFINRRPTSKKGSFEVWIDDEDCDFVFNLLESYAGQPVAAVCAESAMICPFAASLDSTGSHTQAASIPLPQAASIASGWVFISVT